jgi:hypothetical protein
VSQPRSDLNPPLWQEALAAVRHNFAPGLFLWGVAAVVVLLYYFVADSRPVFTQVSDLKAGGGFLYSILSTALFAGLIPFVFLKAMPSTRAQATVGTLVFTVLFWAYRGFEIDLFYRFQGVMFGTVPSLGTVAAKVAFDLFVYNVIWAASLQLLTYHWKNSGFRASAFHGFDWRGYFQRQLPVALLSTWAVWLPVLIFVYSLPSDLQIPLFNLAACFWALVMATLTKQDHQK